MSMKFNQYWDLVPGRKSEYADFVQEEFLPVMKEVGIQVVAGWVVLVGEGPHIINEGIAKDIHHIEAVLNNPSFRSMTVRHMRFIRNYASRVLVSTGRLEKGQGEVQSEGIIKFNQSWNIRPGHEEDYAEALNRTMLATCEDLGIEIVNEWNILIGSGPFIILEGHARSLASLGRALADPHYHRAMARWEDLVEEYRSRILVRHRLFLEAIHEVYGAPIRSISEEEISSMYGPLVD